MTCCDNSNIIESDGFYVCNNCGTCGDKIIIDSVIYYRDGYLSKSRILKHKEIVEHKFGNRTIMFGKEAKESGMFKLYMINRQDYKDKGWSMKHSIPIFNTVCFRMYITNHIKKHAWKIYYNHCKMSKKVPIEAALGACLIISSRFYNIPIDRDKLIDILDISKDKLFIQLDKVSKLLVI